VEVRLDRLSLTMTSFTEEFRTNRPLEYWRDRPPAERA
jgi:hypothetical protein